MIDSYKDKWNKLLGSLPGLPDTHWLTDYFKRNLLDFNDISLSKGEVYKIKQEQLGTCSDSFK